ncbi:radical S-adenosyl methionine domain-containing protein 1, mitochondrial-like [Mytilus californianus]|uniref:radical S-adenosyl methionine domain-containing protein 1, mitochondrial-like n=1 Tax=Mytilus californianus TaxID=6549 RepID=UPI00224847F6|nr:radical S-adenosyl methionine domain-containing protein 1, mitochondrial-like [Mytilus californianus]
MKHINHLYKLHGLIASVLQQTTRRQIQSLAETACSVQNKATLYVHWPYCAKMCSYCNFNKYIRNHVDNTRMTNCMMKEVETLIKISGITEIKSVYFGGGTPSLAETGMIASVIQAVQSSVTLPENAEITLEANPTTTERAKLKEFKDAGVNRLSIGVQSLYNEDLEFLGRQHSVEDAIRCISDAKDLYPGDVSIDIIFGRPNQTVEKWNKELQQLLSLCDDHISLYQLTVERGTPLFKWVQNKIVILPDDEVMADLYETAVEVLESRGFDQYEVSNFAKNGKVGRHNKVYWEGEDYIGVGPGAHGRFTPYSQGKHQREARVQILEPNRWMTEVENQGHGTKLAKPQNQLEQLEELLVMGLRTKDGIKHETWKKRYSSKSMTDLFYNQDILSQYVNSGLLHFDKSGMRASKKALAVLNPIVQDLLNLLNDHWSGG